MFEGPLCGHENSLPDKLEWVRPGVFRLKCAAEGCPSEVTTTITGQVITWKPNVSLRVRRA